MSARIPELGEALTAREVQVLRLVAEGLSNPAIGLRLHLAPDTVKRHMFRIGKKLGASGRTNAVWLACVSGQLPTGHGTPSNRAAARRAPESLSSSQSQNETRNARPTLSGALRALPVAPRVLPSAASASVGSVAGEP